MDDSNNTIKNPSGDGFDRVTTKGKENGTFIKCMKAIREAHFRANRIRGLLTIAGLFSDRFVYREVISMFYVVTEALEVALLAKEFSKNDVDAAVCRAVLALGYRFTKAYEKDLAFLFGNDNDWKTQVEKVVRKYPFVREYTQFIQSMESGEELAGAAFVLWGALVIGGGAVAQPRVEALCGKEATHLFADVTGPGRTARKARFSETFDSFSSSTMIVETARTCMQYNNDMLGSFKRNPWWLKYLMTVVVGVLAVGVGVLVLLR